MLGFELIVEEKIEEAIRAGDFDNLPGAGKPLDLDCDKLVPEDVRLAYRILKNAGLVPPDIELRKEAAGIRELIAATADENVRHKALARLALLETRLEARGGSLPRASPYFDRLVARFDRGPET